MKSSPTTERVYFLDYLRVVACFMVILVHCIEPFYLAHMFVLVPTFSWVSSWGVATPIVMVVSAILTMAITAAIIEILSILPKSKYIIG